MLAAHQGVRHWRCMTTSGHRYAFAAAEPQHTSVSSAVDVTTLLASAEVSWVHPRADAQTMAVGHQALCWVGATGQSRVGVITDRG